MTPCVSVIINCFNGELYLEETLQSVFAQTFQDWELIFWDNCSTDRTSEIIKSYNDPRIKYYYANEKTTLGRARNLAMQKTLGKYIAFIDADDLWMPDFLKTCVETIENESGTAVVYTRFINFDGDKEWLSPGTKYNKLITPKELISAYNIGMSGALFSKTIKDINEIAIDERFSLIEDYDFFIHLGINGTVYYLAEPLMRYRWNAGGLTQNSKWAGEMALLLEKSKTEVCLKPFHYDIQKVYEYVETRDLLSSGNKHEAFKLIIKSFWHNPLILKYIYPVLFGMGSFHRLRMWWSKG